jgi:hypothetical protein
VLLPGADVDGGGSPEAAIDAAGDFILAWDIYSGHLRARVATGTAASGVRAVQTLQQGGGYDQVAIGAGREVVSGFGSGCVAGVTAIGQPFGRLQKLSATCGHDEFEAPDVAVTSDGYAIAVEAHDPLATVYKDTATSRPTDVDEFVAPPGRDFGAASTIAHGHDLDEAQVTAGGHGAAAVEFLDVSPTKKWVISAAYSASDGVFEPAAMLSDQVHLNDHAQPVTTPSGTAVVVWQASTNGNFSGPVLAATHP